jgi:hypothetical protein
MKNLNVMELAWSIYRITPLTMKFRYALIYAWKIAKKGAVQIKDNMLIIKAKLNLGLNYFEKTRTSFKVKLDEYYMNLFLYQLVH